jgi:hypothetical protein
MQDPELVVLDPELVVQDPELVLRDLQLEQEGGQGLQVHSVFRDIPRVPVCW